MTTQLGKMRRWICLLFVICGTVFCLSSGNAIAGAVVKAEGMLTSMEGKREQRSVIISDSGYSVSPAARIVDSNGKTASLEGMPLPSRVYFHYEYTKTGPVVTFMKRYPKIMPQ
jgi:hypothetical protein